ncbi:MAG: hypothetical protein K8F91_09940 [Candidatus Obscuribacterales bacterium]|nr:hypothetical protein [Candidatus Obscuribacterales bacterium]
MPGFTIFPGKDGKNGTTIIPERIFDDMTGNWVRTRDLQMVDMDGSLKPVRLLGIFRHELGQSLSEIYKWKGASIELPNGRRLSTNDLYHEGKRELLERREALQRELVQLHEKLRAAGVSDGKVTSSKDYISLANKIGIFDNHIAGNEIGMEQTLADLWAINEGGSSRTPAFDRELRRVFSRLFDFLVENNWFRSD